MKSLKFLLLPLLLLSVSSGWARNLQIRNLPTLENLIRFAHTQTARSANPKLRLNKTALERNITQALMDERENFLNELSPQAVDSILSLPNGIAFLKQVDGLMTSAAQELANKANLDLESSSKQSKALARIEQIRRIEKKRDTLALAVSKKTTDANFNLVFDYMIQAHFRPTESMNQGAAWPREVKNILYGRKNPNMTAFLTLKNMTLDVLSAGDQGPLQSIRRMKISGTAELIPLFKPTLRAWEVESYYFRRGNESVVENRLPSSQGAAKLTSR